MIFMEGGGGSQELIAHRFPRNYKTGLVTEKMMKKIFICLKMWCNPRKCNLIPHQKFASMTENITLYKMLELCLK